MHQHEVEANWNLMAHAQKPDFVFRRNGRVHLNHRGRQFSRLLAAEVCASVVVILDTPCSETVWRVLVTHSIRHFPLHFLSHASSCAITFQLESNTQSYGVCYWTTNSREHGQTQTGVKMNSDDVMCLQKFVEINLLSLGNTLASQE